MNPLRKPGALIRTPLFRRTFLSLSALALAIVAAFCGILSHTIYRQMSSNIRSANESLAEQAASALETRLQWSIQSLGYLLWRPELIQYMLLPSGGGTENEASIISQLRAYQNSVSGVEELLFYVPLRETLFSSQSSGAVEPEYLSELLAQAAEEPLWSFQVETLHISGSILDAGDSLILRAELILSRDVTGVTYGVLRKSSLNGSFFTPGVLAVSAGGQDIFAFGALEDAGVSGGAYQSKASGWTYTLWMDPDSIAVSPGDVVCLVLPVAALFLIISLAFCYWISRFVYEPIDRLMRVVRSAPGSPIPDREQDRLLGLDGSVQAEEQRQLPGRCTPCSRTGLPPCCGSCFRAVKFRRSGSTKGWRA